MKKNLALILALLLSVFILSACGSKEVTTLEIITPANGDRLTGDTAVTNVTALLKSNRTDVATLPARLMINGTVQGDQILNLNVETTFQIPLANKGIQTVKLEVDQQDGKKVSAETRFVWIPLEGFDVAALSLAKMVNSEDPTTGYFMIGVVLFVIMIVLFAIVMIKNKQSSLTSTIIAACAIIAFIIIVIAAFDPVLAYQYYFLVINAVSGLAGFAIFAYIITTFANKNYAIRGGNAIAVRAKTWWPTGQPLAEIEMAAKEGFYFGDASHIPQTKIAEIAGALFVLPKIVEQAALLMEQFPNPHARGEVIDALYSGGDRAEMHYLTNGMASGRLLRDGTEATSPIITRSSSPGILGSLLGGIFSGFKRKTRL